MKTSESLVKISDAICKAQGQIKGAVKDAANPFFKSKYADLESVIEAIRGPFSANGLGFMQGVMVDQKQVVTRIMHASGEWIETYYPLDCKDWTNPQSVGSAMTYAKRYGLQAAAGIPTVDDDGNAASNVVAKPNPIQQARETQKVVASNPGEYVVTFGKYKGQKLVDLDIHDLNSYCDYVQQKAAQDNKPLQGSVLEFVRNATDFIKLRDIKHQRTQEFMNDSEEFNFP